VIGRVERGTLERGAPIVRVGTDGQAEPFRITKLFGAWGLQRLEIKRARAGEIVVIAGVDSIEVGDTICAPECLQPLPRIAVDPPTVRVRVSTNDSPFAGHEGQFVTSRKLGERLRREALGNVSIRVQDGETPESFVVAGRGELLIAVLIETLRREGYEFAVSRPEIIVRELDGRRCEPVEAVVAEMPDAFAGAVLEKLAARSGRIERIEHRAGRSILSFTAPSRGLFGYRSEFLSDTRGEGVLHRTVTGYKPLAGELSHRSTGAIVASESGKTTAYSLFSIQERATMFLGPGVEVYEGQIVGENRRSKDMNVNVCRAKKLTNIRAAGKDENAILAPPRPVSIESALGWIEDDELFEVTPRSLRLRKRTLPANLRKRAH
jgi:GTP-binding protein